MEKVKIDPKRVIQTEPLMLCSACFKENCNGKCGFKYKIGL